MIQMYLIHIHTVSPIIISYNTLSYLIIIPVLYTTSLPVSMLAHTTFMTVTISFVPLSFCMHACILVDASCNNQSSVSVSHSKCSSATQPVTYLYLYIHPGCTSRCNHNMIESGVRSKVEGQRSHSGSYAIKPRSAPEGPIFAGGFELSLTTGPVKYVSEQEMG